MKRVALVVLMLSMTLPQFAWTHPGHRQDSIDGRSLLHYVTEPSHLFSLLFIAILVVAVFRKVRRVKSEQVKKK